LEGHTFMVVNVEPYKLGTSTLYKFTLQENGVTIYYKYDNFRTYLQPVNFTLPAEYYCEYIKRKVNDHGDIHYRSDIIAINHFRVEKVIYKDLKKTVYTVVIHSFEGKASAQLGTVVLEFENGTSLSFTDEILSYSLIHLTINESQLKTLQENTIKTVKAGGRTKDFKEHGELFRGVINCIPTGNK
ncbi:hypothetical protein, partial [uncultured Flavobacterium sp.]|uniref:hypothetical protein n=1 Tax=uncultured Flavobacterium sp. TaxID=165435 RepID=UPI0025F9BDB2